MDNINWKNYLPCTALILGISSVFLIILFLRLFEEALFFTSLIASVLGAVVGIIAFIKADETKKKWIAGAGFALSIFVALALVLMLCFMFSSA